jgi:hypothetical protein
VIRQVFKATQATGVPGRKGSKRRTVRNIFCISLPLAVAGGFLIGVVPAYAAVELSITPLIPESVLVGQTDVPGTLTIANTSTTGDDTDPITLSAIALVPSCGSSAAAANCLGANRDPGVFSLSSTGTGGVGTACDGDTFNITDTDTSQDQYSFVPSATVILGKPMSATSNCVINFTFDVLKAPTKNAGSGAALQTAQLGSATGTDESNSDFSNGVGTSLTTVNLATLSMSTSATAVAALGSSIVDTATLVPPSGVPGPTGTVTFNVYGPNDPTCANDSVFTSAITLVSPGTTATSDPYPPVTSGTYFWTASYSGDINYNPVTPTCGATDESSAVGVLPSTITTIATPDAVLGTPISDSATLTPPSGDPVATGSITFSVYGPGNSTCTGAVDFTSTVALDVTGTTAASGPYTPTAAGPYNWVATYSGDDNYGTETTACNAANETSDVGQLGQTITFTSNTPSAAVVGGIYTVSATASSGLPVSFSATSSAVCNVSGTLVSFVGPGTCEVDANQAGNGTYSPAPQTSQSFPVTSTSGATSTGGYDLVGRDGGVFVFPTGAGGGFYGSLPGIGVHVNNIVGIVVTNDGMGYFLVGNDGGVFAFGDATFAGSLPGIGVHVNNIVGIVPTTDDKGYYLVGKDGGVFAFGDAAFENSLPGMGVHVDNIVGIAATSDDLGYWLVSATGTVYSLGDAKNFGVTNTGPTTAIAATASGTGYWLLGPNGSVTPFGDAGSYGSLPGDGVKVSNIVSMVPTSDGQGYLMIGSDGGTFAFGNAVYQGSLPGIGVHVNNIVGAVPTA